MSLHNQSGRAHLRPPNNFVLFRTFLVVLTVLILSLGTCRQVETETNETFPTMHRANPARTGVYQSPALERYDAIKWQVKAGDWVFAAPAVTEKGVYFGSYDGRLYASDVETGEEIWRFEIKAPIIASPAAADNLVYFGGMDGIAYALDAETGAERWRFSLGGGIIGSPAVDGDLVYFAADNGLLVALDAASGAERWRFEKPGGPIVFSPAIAAGMIYVPVSDGILYVLDALTGVEQWRYDPGEYSRPDIFRPAGDVVIDNGRAYLMSVNMDNLGFLDAIDPSTQALIWRFPVPAEVFSGPTASQGVLMWGAIDGIIYAVNAETGQQAWTFATGNSIFTAAAAAGNFVYVGSADKNLYALDIRTGSRRWQFRADSGVSSPAIADGIIYVGTESGAFYAIH